MAFSQQLDGKVAIVTGGASGIGKAIASLLVAKGATVVIADIEAGALDKAAGEIGAVAIRMDASSAESVQSLADEVLRRFSRVDLFCSNAGVASMGRIEDMALSDWQWLFGVNFFGTIHGLKAFLPLLRANPEGGHIVITASEAGLHASPMIGGYSVSKSAVLALAEALQCELEEEGGRLGLTVLCPGPVRSNLGVSQRNRPAGLEGGTLVDSDLEASEEGGKLRWIGAERVAEILLDAIDQGEFYAFTHPEMAGPVFERHRRIEEAFRKAEER
jgi:NAD(P)-dependent dehydrogenase (short-subunit alcohol dehydrogenase family)